MREGKDDMALPDQGLRELALFAGAGGGILGGHLLGWRTVCAVEIEDYPRRVLLARQRDGLLPRFPIWDDIKTFDGNPWRGRVDVVSGGFPCQDISAAGQGAGIDGKRSGLWSEMARVICEVQPRFVLVENSPMLTIRGIDRVLGDLAALGYDARWGVLGACDTGAPHYRERIFIFAHTVCESRSLQVLTWDGQKTGCGRQMQEKWGTHWGQPEMGATVDPMVHFKLLGEPGLVRMDDGVASLMDRLKAIGNGQVPAMVRLAWETLTGAMQA